MDTKPPERKKGYGRVFDYVSDFDQNGILYYLASRAKQKWTNPHLSGTSLTVPNFGFAHCVFSGVIKVTFSSLEKGNAEFIVDPDPKDCCTQNVPSSWLTIDFVCLTSQIIS